MGYFSILPSRLHLIRDAADAMWFSPLKASDGARPVFFRGDKAPCAPPSHMVSP
jgi:hypothetical protein